MTEEWAIANYPAVDEFLNLDTGEVTWSEKTASRWESAGVKVERYFIDIPLAQYERLAPYMYD